MTYNKKTILISWLIGVGFGLFFSGIVLSILLYTSNKGVSLRADEAASKQYTKAPEMSESQPISLTKEPEEIHTVTETEQPLTIELEIEPTATAKDITNMLVENGVIADYDEFIAYIVSKDAERTLLHGRKVFPLDADIESVFKILRPY